MFLCFLPLSHSYEHTAGMMFPISLGAEIYFAEGAETLAANMLEVRPTIMTAVPRLYETMHQRILRGMERQSGLQAAASSTWRCASAASASTIAPPHAVERLLDLVADGAGAAQGAARFGGRLKAMVSGGAPLNPEIGSFFLALGVPLLQGYGQTEASPVISANPPRQIKIDTVGPPLDGVEVQDRRGRRDPGARRDGDEGLLERSRGDGARARRRLAAYRRYRRARRRRLYPHHRPQARLHQEFRRRQ